MGLCKLLVIVLILDVNYRDYLWHSLKLDKLKLTDSISERDSEKSI
jgi:hypothetical protein